MVLGGAGVVSIGDGGSPLPEWAVGLIILAFVATPVALGLVLRLIDARRRPATDSDRSRGAL